MVKYLKDAGQVGKLWAHETSRVFADRLINDEDREWFQDLILSQVQRLFSNRL
jgi:dynein heavy chain, axonemal